MMLQSAINVSEGRDPNLIDTLVAAGGPTVVDCHSDPHHHRSVLTLLGPADAVVAGALGILSAARRTLDLGSHEGVHPRYGVVDVVDDCDSDGNTNAVLRSDSEYDSDGLCNGNATSFNSAAYRNQSARHSWH